MLTGGYWEENSKHQWIFYVCDNSSLDRLSEKVNSDEVLCSTDSELINLGIHRVNGRLYSGNYVGVCRLKGINRKNIQSFDGREVILKVKPRFQISVIEMLDAIREDDEFERYLAPQSNRLNEVNKEIDDLYDNELFHFFDEEDPIFLKDNIARESSIITASVFVTLLKGLCSRPLMGKMIQKDENLVGKVKGKIVFNKNIQLNTLKGRNDRIYCRYLQYTEDILENQVLKAALHKAEMFLNRYFGSTSGNKNTFKEMISYCRNALAHVTYTKISRLDLNKIRTTGVYIYYKPVINAAKMVLNEITLEANGASAVTSYVVPYAISMDKLFEMYVRAYFKKAGVLSYDSNECGVHIAQYDNKTAVLREKSKEYANYISGNIKPDIIFYDSETGNHVIFDVKYKNPSNTKASRSDRLQILAYGLMMDCLNVGNIFPTQDGTNNIYYKKNEINSRENCTRYYNQMELSIGSEWKFIMQQKNEETTLNVIDYLKQLLAENAKP